jgi:hypothetical protein
MVKSDSLDTNVLGSSSKGVILAQNMGTMLAADAAVSSALTKGITGGLKSVGVKNVSPGKFLFKVLVTKNTEQKLIKTYTNSAVKRAGGLMKTLGRDAMAKLSSRMAAKVATQTAAKVSAKVATEVTEKALIKASTTAGQAAAEGAIQAGVTGGSLCAATGAATVGVGCVVGAVVTVVMLAFDVMNLIMSITDKSGILKVLHKADVDEIAKSLREQMAQGDQSTSYLEDEIFFEPLLFVFDVDPETFEVSASEKWGKKYNDYQDEYMKSIGITGDWRARLEAQPLTQPTPPPKTETSKKLPWWVWIIIAIVCFIFCGLIIYVVADSDNGTNSSG